MAKAAAALSFAALHPYRSFLFLQVRSGKVAKPLTDSIIQAAGEIVEARVSAGSFQPGRAKTDGLLRSRFATYRYERSPSWTSDPRFGDVTHHVVVASAYKGLIAVFVSEDRLRDQLGTALDEGSPDPFGSLHRIPESRLNAAFVKGEARTLWLSATHSQTSRKPDRKVLSGIDLRDALNPLDDQSFFFTAARCRQPGPGKVAYGVSPKKSTLWVGPSRDWAEYQASACFYLNTLHDCSTDERSPLPILASTVDVPLDQATLGSAFELSLAGTEAPAEPQGDGEIAAEPRAELSLELLNASPPKLQVEVLNAQNIPLGRCDLSLRKVGHVVAWQVLPATGSPNDSDAADELAAQVDSLRAWFDQGYMVAGDAVFKTHYRELPFAGFRWADFSGYDVRLEKPTPLAPTTIGAQQSLFCWMRSKWAAGELDWLPATGWLACNDGAMEIADFIHFVGGTTPVLTLVHVKAAKSTDSGRPVRVTPYEVVVSQALKNLRHLDARITANEFFAGLSASLQAAVWTKGGAAQRKAMAKAVKKHGARAARRVVVVQPHTLKSQREVAMVSTSMSARRRIAQLHTLLCAAQGECAALGAELIVVGDAG